MAEIGDAVNLRDFAALHVGTQVGDVAEVISETNQWAEDAPMVEANNLDHHTTIERLTNPTGNVRAINEYVADSKGSERQVVESISLLQNRSAIDIDLVNMAGDPAKFRWEKDKAHITGIGEKAADLLIYGDQTTTPREFNGLAKRYSTPSATNLSRGFQLIDGGGTGSTNTSMYLVGWGQNTAYIVYPKGSSGGISIEDRGMRTKDSTSGSLDVYETVIKWNMGLAIEDYGYGVRACNIDVATLTKNGSTGADLVDICDRMVSRIKDTNTVTPAFLVNRWAHSFLSRQCSNRQNNLLAMDNFTGKDGKTRRVLTYNGIPIRRLDAILNTETAVSGTFASL